jgi:type VI secretion system secreted protein VgrG
MAQLTTTTINIDGVKIRQFSSFSLVQGIYNHHFFSITCPAESIDGTIGTIFNKSKNLMGAKVSVEIESLKAAGKLKFNGIVTKIETERYSGSSGDIVISGFSPTILLDNGPHCKSWEKKAVKNIVQDVLSHFPANDLKPKVAPEYGETLAYYVQYKETAWQFLKRICSTFGEWLYYDGQSLIVGPPNGPSIPLLYGNNLSRFSMSLEVIPADQEAMAYDYINNEVYNSTPNGIEVKAGLSELGEHAYKTSHTVYNTKPKIWNNTFLTNKKQLDEVVNIQSAMRSSNHVRINGTSGNLGVTVGGKVTINGQNIYNRSKEDYGECRVISVNHYTDGQGNYSNDFVAIPGSIKLPPVTSIQEPECETQSAIVTDNNDVKGLGRVRVRFHWMKPSEKTPWIRVTSPHGGGDKGMFFIPELGEEAIICFEGNSPTKPFVNGTVYHGKAKTSFANEGNDVKALQTRSGNKMVMNDKDGSVYMSDKGGANSLMDGAGNITTCANENSTLNAGSQSVINVGSGQSVVTMDKAGNVTIDAKTSITIKVGGNVINITKEGITTTAAEGNISTDAKAGAINITALETMDIHSTGALSASTSADLTITGGPSAKIISMDTDII